MNEQDRWRRVDEILAACLEMEPASRTSYLDEACDDDTALRREVEELLAFDRVDHPGLDGITWGSPAGVAPVEGGATGDLGLYRLLEPIGEGGMGVVYRARRDDGRYERDVAIKILKNGILSRETLGRFRNECRILAQLDHEGIARLYDAGCTAEGLPYLVMEHVDGLPLDRFVQERDGSIAERLRLFQQICRAVSHAHSHLIVHRDLKPSNISVVEGEVGEDGLPQDFRVKLLDFGIAKMLTDRGEQANWTQGQAPMTPRYASPEQSTGAPITTATDVYALGLLCGELVTGQAPGVETEGPPVSHGLGRLPADLQAVLQKATAEAPADRYPSAEQLSEDIGRYLGGRPVIARPPTPGYRFRRFVGRHKLPLAAASVLFVLTACAAFGFAVLAHELAQERDRARIEARIAGQVTDFLVGLFSQAEPGNRGPQEPTASELLRRGAERVEPAFDRSTDDLPVRVALLDAIGRAYHSLSRYDEAAPLLHRALELRREMSPADPPSLRRALIRAAEAERLRSDYDRAESLAKEALTLGLGSGGRDSRWSEAARLLGQISTHRGDLESAERWLTSALDADRRRKGSNREGSSREGSSREGSSREGGAEEALGKSHQALATLAFERRDDPLAEHHARRAVEHLGAALGVDHPLVLSALNELTIALQNQGKLKDAVVVYQDLLRRQVGVFGEPHEVLVGTLNGIGTTYYDLGDYEAAERELRRSLDMLYALGSRSTLVDARVSTNLARTLWEAGRGEEAIEQYRRALDIFRQRVEAGSPSLGAPLTFLGGALCSEAQVDEGEALLDEARQIYLDRLGADHYRLALLDGTRAKCAVGRGLPAEARDLLESAKARLVGHFGADHRIIRKIEHRLSELSGS